MDEIRKTGRVTIPTDLDVVPETLEILKKWGADAIRDCDGTDFPQQLKDADAKIYSTYYTTRKDNAWAKANPDEVQQCYIMTGFYTAPGDTVTIPPVSYTHLSMPATPRTIYSSGEAFRLNSVCSTCGLTIIISSGLTG